MKLPVFAFVLVCTLTLAATAADWPQWRGPNRDGVSKETGLLQEWPADGPKLLWQVKDVGDGYSTPAVVGDRIYLCSNKGKEDEFVQARSAADGKQLWSTKLGKVGPNKGPQYPGARSTPTIDGDRLYVLGSDGDLVCAKIADGAIVWRKNLRTEFGGAPGFWAYSESPLVDGNVVICTPGGKEATLLALDKSTGDVIWKSPITGGDEAAYASIIIVNYGGVKQYVQFLQRGLVGVDAKSGKFLWRYDKTGEKSPANIPTPVEHDGYIYTGSGLGGGGLVKLNADGGSITAEQIYFRKKEVPVALGGSVLVGNFMYGTNANSLMCLDFKTGDVKWQDKCVGAGAPCYADGRIYVHGENGELALVEATPEAYREKGRFSPPDQPKRGSSRAWAYPVIANGRLYVRDLGVMWCFDVKAAK